MSEDPIDTAWKDFDARRDASTFERLYMAARDLVSRLALRAVGDPDLAADVTQSMFARLWMDPERRPREDLTPRQAVIRWALDEARTARRRRERIQNRELPLSEGAPLQSRTPPPDRVVADRILLEKIRTIVAALPEPYQQAIQVCEFEGMTHREASDLLGLSPSTVKSQVRRGKAMLAKRLRNAGITLSVAAAISTVTSESPALSLPAAAHVIAQAPHLVEVAGPISASGGAGVSLGVAASVAGGVAAVAAVVILALASPWKGNNPTSAAPTPPIGEKNEAVLPPAADQPPAAAPARADNSSSASLSHASSSVAASSSSPAPFPSYPPRTWRGRVVSLENGLPIPNARVSVFPVVQPGGVLYLDETDSTRSTGTDSEGHFEILQATPFDYGALQVEADGFASAFDASFTPGVFKREFGLKYGGAVEGVVVDSDGNPLEGAIVGAIGIPHVNQMEFHGYHQMASRNDSALARTDREGRFRLEGLPRDRTVMFPYRHEASRIFYSRPVRSGEKDVRLTIPKAVASIHGRVLDAAGNPVSQGWIDGGLLYQLTLRGHNEGPIAADGTFQLDYTSTGTLSLSLHIPFSGESLPHEAWGYHNRTVELAAGENPEIVIRCPPMIEVRGRVVDDDTGDPIPGVRISERPYRTFWFELPVPSSVRMEAFTDSDGRFSLCVPPLIEGNVSLHFLAPAPWVGPVKSGSSPRDPRSYVESDSWSLPAVSDDGIVAGDLRLVRGASLEATLLQTDGNTPMPDADVSFRIDRVRSKTRTDAKGHFQFRGAPGSTVSVYGFTSAGYVEAQDLTLPAAGESTNCALVLQPPASVSGQVLDEDNVPVAGCCVRSDMATYVTPEIAKPDSENGYEANRPKGVAYTDASGCFVLRPLPSGTHVVRVETYPGEGVLPGDEFTVDLEPGEDIGGRILYVFRAEGRIEGIVVDEAGRPIPDANLFAQMQPSLVAFSDESGRFEFSNLKRGRAVSLAVQHPRFARREIASVLPDAGLLTIVLPRRKRVVLRVTDAATGAPVAPYQYFVSPAERAPNFDDIRTRCEDPSGIATFLLVPGDYVVGVAQKDDLPNVSNPMLSEAAERIMARTTALFTVPMEGEDETTVEVRYGGTAELSGTVIDGETGLPISGAWVSLLRDRTSIPDWIYDSDPEYKAETNSKGEFTITNIKEGQWQIVAARKGEVPKGREIREVTAETTVVEPVHLVLDPGGSVTGVLDLGEGGTNGCSSPRVTLAPESWPDGDPVMRPQFMGLKGDMSFAFRGVPSGIYRVTVWSSTTIYPNGFVYLMTDKATTEVREGETSEVRLSFADFVFLHGRVLTNGEPTRDGYRIALLKDGDEGANVLIHRDASDSYRTKAAPGDYRVGIRIAGLGLRILDGFVRVEPGVPDQEIDIDVPVGRLEIEFRTLKETPFSGGTLVIEPDSEAPGNRTPQRIPVAARKISFYPVPEGKYTLRFEWDSGAKTAPVSVHVRSGEQANAMIPLGGG